MGAHAFVFQPFCMGASVCCCVTETGTALLALPGACLAKKEMAFLPFAGTYKQHAAWTYKAVLCLSAPSDLNKSLSPLAQKSAIDKDDQLLDHMASVCDSPPHR